MTHPVEGVDPRAIHRVDNPAPLSAPLSAPVPGQPPSRWLLVLRPGDVRQQLCDRLATQGWSLQVLEVATDWRPRLQQERPDGVLLDSGWAGFDALDACRALRALDARLPIVLLGGGNEEIDHVIALESGADDYLAFPWGLRQLQARMRALLRRQEAASRAQPEPPPLQGLVAGLISVSAVKVGPWWFLAESRCLQRGQELRVLPEVEAALLAELTARPHQPVDRQRLRLACHGDQPVLPRAVDAAVMRLRRAVEPDPELPRYIQTVRGVGYVFVPGAELPTRT